MTNLRVPAREEFLESIRAYVVQTAAAAGASEGILFRIELAVEEALTNIIKYAYPGKAGEIEVSCSTGPCDTLVLEIRDWGGAFDPLHFETPDLTQDFQDRPIGGLGIYLIRKIADKVTYCALEDGNQLTLTFLLA
jgi:anti-sigma regulatory factor (Ser/Thr protein kinase)